MVGYERQLSDEQHEGTSSTHGRVAGSEARPALLADVHYAAESRRAQRRCSRASSLNESLVSDSCLASIFAFLAESLTLRVVPLVELWEVFKREAVREQQRRVEESRNDVD